jgi:hypothetical protein
VLKNVNRLSDAPRSAVGSTEGPDVGPNPGALDPPAGIRHRSRRGAFAVERYVFEQEGPPGVAEKHLVICTPEEWADSPESEDPGWGVVRAVDGRVMALKLIGPGLERAIGLPGIRKDR